MIKLYLAVKICKHVNNIKLQFLKTEMFIIAKLADLENRMEYLKITGRGGRTLLEWMARGSFLRR